LAELSPAAGAERPYWLAIDSNNSYTSLNNLQFHGRLVRKTTLLDLEFVKKL
jgi:hypothetical protein